MKSSESDSAWVRLKGKISARVWQLPNLAERTDRRDPAREVHDKVVSYIERNVVNKPWADHLALCAVLLSQRRLEPTSVLSQIHCFHARFSSLFKELNLSSMSQWKPAKYIRSYLQKEFLPEDSQYKRAQFWQMYKSQCKYQARWLETLTPSDRRSLQKFILPVVDIHLVDDIIKWTQVIDERQRRRKMETDALLPYFASIRSEAHLRFNKLARLRQAYYETVQKIESGRHSLPFEFTYDEGGDPELGIPAQERLYFRIWDFRSFIMAHPKHYCRASFNVATYEQRHCSPDRSIMFLEFIKAESLVGGTPPGLWFKDLSELDVIGRSATLGTVEEVERKQAWLHEWGYGKPSEDTQPFRSGHVGVLCWANKSGEARFMGQAQRRSGRILIPVEPFYVSAMFGLLALNIFTTTGARINEALQISLDEECFVRLVMPAPPNAKDQSPRIRFAFRVIPKGERANQRANYFVSKETCRLIEKVAKMLADHYSLDLNNNEKLPVVKFNPLSHRSHRFGKARYLFQYSGRHMNEHALTASMRFLLHGLVFMNSNGKPVVVKAHLLRHVFATHAVHVEKVPVDIVRQLLHQKDLHVTDYYSRATDTIVAEENDRLLSKIATHLDVKDAVIRSPDELKQQFNEAVKTHGTLTNVTGGDCTCDKPCPGKFMCVGCPAKVPDPSKRHQIEEKKRWAQTEYDYYTQEGLVAEAERMRQLMIDCDHELREMDLIIEYRKDEGNVVFVQITRKGR